MKLKSLLFVALLFLLSSSYAQSVHKTKNVGVILIDGYRWQELFKGADFDLLNDKKYTPNDSSQRFKKFWSENLDERRNKTDAVYLMGEMKTKKQNFQTQNAKTIASLLGFNYHVNGHEVDDAIKWRDETKIRLPAVIIKRLVSLLGNCSSVVNI